MRSPLFMLCIAGSVAAVAGCHTKRASIEPAETADVVDYRDAAARSRDNGVTLVAAAEEWIGEAYITQKVTPLLVTIRNDSGQPLRLRYEDFVLVGETGRKYRAMSPHRVEGIVDVDLDEVTPSGLEYDERTIYRPRIGLEPDVVIYEGTFTKDVYYDNSEWGVWDLDQGLPTPEMVAGALPEGVLSPDGYVTGWLYFQKVDDDEDRVALRADLTHADDARRFAQLEIPFED